MTGMWINIFCFWVSYPFKRTECGCNCNCTEISHPRYWLPSTPVLSRVQYLTCFTDWIGSITTTINIFRIIIQTEGDKHAQVVPGDACEVRNKPPEVLLSYSVMVTPGRKREHWPSPAISSTWKRLTSYIWDTGRTPTKLSENSPEPLWLEQQHLQTSVTQALGK